MGFIYTNACSIDVSFRKSILRLEYQTEEEPHMGRVDHARGKVLGGSSSIGMMLNVVIQWIMKAGLNQKEWKLGTLHIVYLILKTRKHLELRHMINIEDMMVRLN